MLNHDQVQEALSARMDGEDYDLEDDVIDTHIAHCDKCKAFQERAAKLSFSLTPHTPLEPSQELAEDILAQVEPEWRRVSGGRLASLAGARVALVVLAIVFVIWAITLIVASGPFTGVAEGGAMLNPDSNPVEAEHLIESAALRLGLAAGMIFSAWRPHHVAGLLPVVGTAFFFLAGFAMRDIALSTLSSSQVYTLCGLGAALVVLVWTWLADRGYFLRHMWKNLSADPY
ncbi:zf-HC2 domain-containing protein [Corynebacterium ammoniagenes]|uniref:Zinc-finger domain-containing protein n=2 Tax=Corynebacterium ammoniagenes TaxID=1697 RepID=A0AAV5G2C4_CORAM|nr:zf-HC2 domain-containing protein [Corynebacterium ammoniagenes]APT83112.1 membrane protein [Corynebacterium ammoniagenes DSM 20306]AQS74139.1 hypothetical protein CA40472_09675 [Corynebacterium ammoniagenes]NMF31253.1 hypothetical protein [Corynebacterium ammoniagenes]GJN42613.1 hypothetical protein CAT723_10920 [Corynebacterium ammoniagenes]